MKYYFKKKIRFGKHQIQFGIEKSEKGYGLRDMIHGAICAIFGFWFSILIAELSGYTKNWFVGLFGVIFSFILLNKTEKGFRWLWGKKKRK